MQGIKKTQDNVFREKLDKKLKKTEKKEKKRKKEIDWENDGSIIISHI